MKRVSQSPDSGQAANAGFYTAGAAFAISCITVTAIDASYIAEGVLILSPDIGNSHFLPAGSGMYIAAGVALTVASLKAVEMACIAALLRQRLWVTALAMLAFAAMLHIFSSVCAIGYAGMGRDMLISNRGDAQDARKRLQTIYDAARARKASLPATRAVSAIQAALQAKEKDLSEAAKTDRGALRKERDALKAELGMALDGERADAELKAAADRLATLHAPQSRDPQAETIAKLLPWEWATAERVGIGLPLLLSLLIEFGAPVCGLLSSAMMSMAQAARATVDQAEPAQIEHGPARTKETKRGPAVDQARTSRGPAVDHLPAKPSSSRTTIPFSPEKLDQIKSLKSAGFSEREIERLTGVARSTAKRWLTVDQERTTGGPVMDQVDRNVVRLAAGVDQKKA